MIHPTLRQLAYGITLPAFAVSPKLAKETVYMPSQVAQRVLGPVGKPKVAERADQEARE